MDTLINTIAVLFSFGFIATLQAFLLYRLSYLQIQLDNAEASLRHLIDLVNQTGPEDEHQPDMGAGYASDIHNTIHG